MMENNGVADGQSSQVQAWARGLAAAVVAYLFLIVLITSALQVRVAERLAALEPPQDYSAAYAKWDQGDLIKPKLAGLERQKEQLEQILEEAQTSKDSAGYDFLTKEGPLRSLQQSLRAIPSCDFAHRPQLGVSEMSEAISSLRKCSSDAAFPPALRAEAERFLANDAEPLQQTADRWRASAAALDATAAKLDDARRQMTELTQQQVEFKRIDNSFSDIAVLKRQVLLGPASFLAELPPAAIQILLAFVSGLFGALLVTLVIVVYPNVGLSLTSPVTRYWHRLLLGGLIALCTFVVLGGGTAVLANTNAFSEGQANYLAFCAIGIFSGMFSDRVAYWLSARAAEFFGRGTAGTDSRTPD